MAVLKVKDSSGNWKEVGMGGSEEVAALSDKIDNLSFQSVSGTTSRFTRCGQLIVANFYGLSTNAPVAPIGYRPLTNVSFPIVIILSGKAYMGYVAVDTSGTVSPYYYDYANTPATPASGSLMYGCGTWFTDASTLPKE